MNQVVEGLNFLFRIKKKVQKDILSRVEYYRGINSEDKKQASFSSFESCKSPRLLWWLLKFIVCQVIIVLH